MFLEGSCSHSSSRAWLLNGQRCHHMSDQEPSDSAAEVLILAPGTGSVLPVQVPPEHSWLNCKHPTNLAHQSMICTIHLANEPDWLWLCTHFVQCHVIWHMGGICGPMNDIVGTIEISGQLPRRRGCTGTTPRVARYVGKVMQKPTYNWLTTPEGPDLSF